MAEMTARRPLSGALLVGVAVVVCGLAGASTAFAQSGNAIEEAKAHFKTGTQLYDENNFRGALVEFQRAFELAPSFRILYNIGQVDMELADYAGALIAYKRYLREGGPDVDPDRVKEVEGEIARLMGRVGRITVQTAGGAEVLVDDLSVGYAPLPEPITVNVGRHKVTVHPTGKPASDRLVDVAGQQELTVALANELPSAPAVAAAVETKAVAPPKPPSKVPGYAMATITVGLGATAGAFAYFAHEDQNSLARLRSSFPVTKAALDAEEAKEVRSAALCDAFTGAAIVSAAITTYLIVHHHTLVTERLALAPTAGGAVAIVRF